MIDAPTKTDTAKSVSASTISNLNERAFESVEAWQSRPLEGSYPYVYVDGIYLKLSRVPRQRRTTAAAMIKAIHSQESLEACRMKAASVAEALEGMRLSTAAKCVRDGAAETLSSTRFPAEHWRRIRTNYVLERLNREIRRRTNVVGTFPDGTSALMLVSARLMHIGESQWGLRRYPDVSLLDE